MENILKYLTEITVSGAAFSFIIGLLKWLDERSRDREERQYQWFHRMVCLASGADESGRTIKMPQQLAAIYQLQRYKQYAFASVPVLEHLLREIKDERDPRVDDLSKAINETIEKLR
jgi:hypothetical protein